jgi:hypothetical protein
MNAKIGTEILIWALCCCAAQAKVLPGLHVPIALHELPHNPLTQVVFIVWGEYQGTVILKGSYRRALH